MLNGETVLFILTPQAKCAAPISACRVNLASIQSLRKNEGIKAIILLAENFCNSHIILPEISI